MVTIDYFVDGETVDLPVGSYYAERFTYSKAGAVVWVEDDIFTPYYKDFVSVDYDSFSLTRSFIFNKAKYISYTAHTLSSVWSEIDEFSQMNQFWRMVLFFSLGDA